MRREGAIGAASFLALAAVVGFTLQSGPKQEMGGRADGASAITRSKPSVTKSATHEYHPGCRSLEEALEEFLEIKELSPPEQCYDPGGAPGKSGQDVKQKTSQLKFVIALLPDPVHTHLSALFDQFAVAIQEGAQDEKYDFDSSWLPWDDDDSHYALFADEKASNQEKESREKQPGIILFRKTLDCPETAGETQSHCKEDLGALSQPYREGLVIFVVGEEATHGIHREQFQNALGWIAALQPKTETKIWRLGILGPTFSGSLSSLAQVLSEPDTKAQWDLSLTPDGPLLAIYSGSVSGKSSARLFQNTFDLQVRFHSFVQSDDEILRRFCKYMGHEQPKFDASRVAIISEDETAYGKSGVLPSEDGRSAEASVKAGNGKAHNDDHCPDGALWLYYPRDISALRGAYQTKSLFDSGTTPQSADPQRRNLPTDLADPTGKVHDSIRSYGGNQTPLTQEAFLLEIVAALRELHARYILLRSSNTLDQLFLTNFLRRSYPDGRIVIFGSDLMFIRESGATGLSGTMTLSTYPLFPLERDWTEHQSLPAADRVFNADATEGTYVALRLLLNNERLKDRRPETDLCHVLEKDEDKKEDAIFVPPVSCMNGPPIPDYSAPFWTLSNQCGEFETSSTQNIPNTGDNCAYLGPATWLSVIGVNRFWPMASLTKDTPNAPEVDLRKTERMIDRETDPGGRPEMPQGMKVFLAILAGFSLFHALCCGFGSYTAKPSFRAHFASTCDLRHSILVFAGSTCVAFLALVTAWGCGVLNDEPAAGLVDPLLARYCMALVCLMAYGAIIANGYTAWRLSKDIPTSADLPRSTTKDFIVRGSLTFALFLVAVGIFYHFFIWRVERDLVTENRVLTYWRAMHLTSGVSPIVPILSILVGLYLSFWFTLHGLALFGPDRPRLPLREQLAFEVEKSVKNYLRMFSQEDAAEKIEAATVPLNWKTAAIASGLFVLFLVVPWKIAGGVPVRSLGAETYSIIFLVGLDACCVLAIVEAWRLYEAWEELKRLLAFLDRLPLRRTLAVLHGFSWGSVWKMSGNVLEVRYKVISRQIECMNHTIASLREFLKKPLESGDIGGAQSSLDALAEMRSEGVKFADWYSTNYTIPRAGDLTSFRNFQNSVAAASGTLLTKVLVPAWRKETGSLVVAFAKDEKAETTPNPPPQAKEEHIRNAEEFVCLHYLGFVQNVLGRLRTMAMTIVVLFLATTVAMSTYPFEPRQALSAILIALFVIVGAVIVRVYADMHRDATLSHVTNTMPGELGTEFWFKIIGFGLAPLVGLLARVFPSITDFIFSWLQPGISSLK
jgi:hypothetical protein